VVVGGVTLGAGAGPPRPLSIGALGAVVGGVVVVVPGGAVVVVTGGAVVGVVPGGAVAGGGGCVAYTVGTPGNCPTGWKPQSSL
jgi:hypothetical protein